MGEGIMHINSIIKKSTLTLITMATLLFGNETQSYPFMGVSLTSQSVEALNEKQQESAFGVRYGKQSVDWRTLFSYEYSKGYQKLGAEVDKILLDSMFKTAKIRPYTGLSAGVLSLDNANLVDNDGYYWGANVGFIVYATDEIDVDVSYHYDKIGKIDEADNMQGASLLMHYFF